MGKVREALIDEVMTFIEENNTFNPADENGSNADMDKQSRVSQASLPGNTPINLLPLPGDYPRVSVKCCSGKLIMT